MMVANASDLRGFFAGVAPKSRRLMQNDSAINFGLKVALI
jgi:hypothetical protein